MISHHLEDKGTRTNASEAIAFWESGRIKNMIHWLMGTFDNFKAFTNTNISGDWKTTMTKWVSEAFDTNKPP